MFGKKSYVVNDGMATNRLQIVLDNPAAKYVSGDAVRGVVKLHLERPKVVKEIDLVAKGTSKVKFVETADRYYTSHTSKEKFLRTRLCLHRYGDHDGQLMPGIYEYPFSFRLLCKSPCSFEGEYGHIRYTIKAVVVRNICKSNYETERNFVVPSVVNLNAIKGAGEPAYGIECKSSSLWRHDSEEIKARAWTDRMGYVAGQTILFSAQVENHSGRRMLGSSVRLVQKITYHAESRTKTVKETLFELNRGPFSETETWDQVRIPIPANTPAKLQHCNNIEINYRVKFAVDIGIFSKKLKIPLNIIIGDIPLDSSSSQ